MPYSQWQRAGRKTGVRIIKGNVVSKLRYKPLNPVEKKQVKKIVGADSELKQQTLVAASNAGGTAGTVSFTVPPTYQQMTGWLQGVAQSARVGDRVRLKRIDIRLNCWSNLLANQVCRFLLFSDSQNNGAAAVTSADLFTDTAALDAPNWPININNSKRYHIHIDRMINLNNLATVNTVTTAKHLNFSIKFKGLGKLIQFNNGNAGTNADIISGAMYAAFMSTNNANVPTASYDVNLLYTDA